MYRARVCDLHILLLTLFTPPLSFAIFHAVLSLSQVPTYYSNLAPFFTTTRPAAVPDFCARFARWLKGQELIILEAMKMEHTVPAPFAGTVDIVSYAVGDLVDEGSTLITVKLPCDPPSTPSV